MSVLKIVLGGLVPRSKIVVGGLVPPFKNRLGCVFGLVQKSSWGFGGPVQKSSWALSAPFQKSSWGLSAPCQKSSWALSPLLQNLSQGFGPGGPRLQYCSAGCGDHPGNQHCDLASGYCLSRYVLWTAVQYCHSIVQSCTVMHSIVQYSVLYFTAL